MVRTPMQSDGFAIPASASLPRNEQHRLRVWESGFFMRHD
jgi:hypothetical protein